MYQVGLGRELLSVGELGLVHLGREQLQSLQGDVVVHGGVQLGGLLQSLPIVAAVCTVGSYFSSRAWILWSCLRAWY